MSSAMGLLALLIEFLFTPGSVDLAKEQYGIGVFAIAAGLVGLVVVSADFMLYRVRETSVLKLSYIFPNAFLLWIFWGLGAALGAFLGAITDIVQLSVQSSAVVGITWPLLLPRLVQAPESEQAEQEAGIEDQP
jgi:hypothetical protein